jgi:hypothetical protein
MGTRPAGQSGQSGQLSPTPDALTYPPIEIKIKRAKRVDMENVLRRAVLVLPLHIIDSYNIVIVLSMTPSYKDAQHRKRDTPLVSSQQSQY